MIPGFMKYRRLSYSNTVIADSPLAYWRLGETSGTSAADLSGNGYTGTYVGGVTLGTLGLIATSTNTGAAFDGSTGRVDVGAIAALYNLSRNFSVEWWMKPAVVTNYQAIFSFGLSANVTGGFMIRLNTTGGVDVLQDNIAQLFSLATGFTANTKYHCVFTVDASGNYGFYINGASAFSGSLSATFAGGYVTLGADSNRVHAANIVNYFSGELDELAIYGTALSAAQVSAHYAAAT